MECIYYKNKNKLTFKGQEHIFPAGLGGIKKLPKDYVSQEANNYFSKLENYLMHGSLITMHRALFGPSKRKDKKEGKRIIWVLENVNNSSNVELGYIREGTPYTIPQVYVDMTGHMNFSVSSHEGIKELNSFIELLNLEIKKFISKESKKIIENDIIIGYSQKTIYVAFNPKTKPSIEKINAIRKTILSVYLSNNINSNKNNIHYVRNQVSTNVKLSETIDNYRVFGKIAFNVLADLKGKDYVLHNDFDEFRNLLMSSNNSKNNTDSMDNDNFLNNDNLTHINFLPSLTSLPNIDKMFPEQSHWCILFNNNGDLCATVCLYNIFKRYIFIAKNRGRDMSDIDGLICDWKNKKEYKLIDYVIQYIDYHNSQQ